MSLALLKENIQILVFTCNKSVLDTTLCDKVCQVTCGRSVVFSGFLQQ